MKTIAKIALAAALVLGSSAAALFGSFGHALTSGGVYSTNVTVPSAASVTQSAAVFDPPGVPQSSTVVNDGPLGNFNSWPGGPAIYYTGNISAGTWYVYQSLFLAYPSQSGGYSATSITW